MMTLLLKGQYREIFSLFCRPHLQGTSKLYHCVLWDNSVNILMNRPKSVLAGIGEISRTAVSIMLCRFCSIFDIFGGLCDGNKHNCKNLAELGPQVGLINKKKHDTGPIKETVRRDFQPLFFHQKSFFWSLKDFVLISFKSFFYVVIQIWNRLLKKFFKTWISSLLKVKYVHLQSVFEGLLFKNYGRLSYVW